MRFSRIAALAVGLPALLGGAVAGSAPAAVAAAALTQRPGPAATAFGEMDLEGIAAVSGQLAWAVGDRQIGTGPATKFQPAIMRWNGTSWTQAPSPGLPSGGLAGVAVTSAADAWAVGSSGADTSRSPSRSLIEHWNGTSWSQVPGPHPAGSFLGNVSALSASSAWAVGDITKRNGNCPCRAITEHWNGTSWKLVASPHPAGLTLSGVADVSPGSAWAVGDRSNTAVIEHWNGTSWKLVASPHPAGASLNGVTAVSARSIWAVGSRGGGEKNPSQALIEHWNGTAWRQVPSPATPPLSRLFSVTVLSAHSAWAVGNFDGGGLIEHWNGTAWKLTIPGGPDSTAFSLFDVAATSASNAWIVGLDGTHGGLALILHWNGTGWH